MVMADVVPKATGKAMHTAWHKHVFSYSSSTAKEQNHECVAVADMLSKAPTR